MGRDDGRSRRGGRDPNAEIGGSQVPGGMIQRDILGRIPTSIVHVKSHNPIAGAIGVMGSPAGTALAQLAYYQTPDNVPRRVTVIVTVNSVITGGNGQQALYVKITVGSDRGSVSQWVAAPCQFPCEGQFVKVEANLANSAPSVQSDPRTLSPGTQIGTPYPQTSQFSTFATALIIDGWTDDGPSILLQKSTACGSASLGTPGNFVAGPVIIESISLTNTNATGQVLIAVCDSGFAGSFQPLFQVLTVYVPALTTVSVGKDLLGTFGVGVNVLGIVAPPSVVNSEDANGANVYATIRGRYLLPGGT